MSEGSTDGVMRTLIIDNYGSFSFNLFQRLAVINGVPPIVVKNDALDVASLMSLDVDNIVLSPGPGSAVREADFGVCSEVLRRAHVPMLGVCLGHQGIGHVFGGEVRQALEPRHGQRSAIFHDGSELWRGLPQGFQAVRYHSLVVDEALPPPLLRSAWTEDGVLMGLRHRDRPIWGVQFHPESIGTEFGDKLLENFRDLTRERRPAQKRYRPNQVAPPRPPQRLSPPPTPSPAPPRHQSGRRLRVRRLERFVEPERAFLELYAEQRDAFWLDSSRHIPGYSRFSFMGDARGPRACVISYDGSRREVTERCHAGVRTLSASIYDYLDAQLRERTKHDPSLPFDFQGGYVGYFGYELRRESGASLRHTAWSPDAMFLLVDRFLAFDHEERLTYLVSLCEEGDDAAQAEGWFEETEKRLREARSWTRPPTEARRRTFRLGRPPGRYLEDVRACQRFIREGESYELCLTNQLHTGPLEDVVETYRTLRTINPAPYSALLRFGELSVLSSSPERFLRVDAAGHVEAKPIKGTRPRGRDPEEDARIREQLARDEKERAENLIIVDLLRNDLGASCEPGSVEVPKLMEVESYETVHHLVSTIRGKLRPDVSLASCIREAFPGGSMTGAPKLRAMNLLDTLEEEARGVYSGALGFLSFSGKADLSIVIRTLVATPDGCSIGTGGAVVHQSDPSAEFEETLVKARPAVAALLGIAKDDASQGRVDEIFEALRARGEVTV